MKRMARTLLTALALTAGVAAVVAARQAAKPLDIYIVDTEGGKAALFVTPTGQSVLIDSGNPGGRDTDRLMAAVTEAGLKQIDYLDHHALSRRSHRRDGGARQAHPGRHVHRPRPDVEEREQVANFQATYAEMWGKAKHLVVKPGDRLPITGLDWRDRDGGGQRR